MKDNCLMLAISFLSALLCGVAAASPYPGGVWQPGPAAYGFIVEEDLAVVMDDGVVLNASAAFPADLNTGKKAGGAFPVVVELTPYVTLAKPVTPMTFFAEHGYISVVVRVRGTGKSEGDLQLFGRATDATARRWWIGRLTALPVLMDGSPLWAALFLRAWRWEPPRRLVKTRR